MKPITSPPPGRQALTSVVFVGGSEDGRIRAYDRDVGAVTFCRPLLSRAHFLERYERTICRSQGRVVFMVVSADILPHPSWWQRALRFITRQRKIEISAQQ